MRSVSPLAYPRARGARTGGSPGTRACEVAAREANRWPPSISRCQTAQSCSFPRRVVAPGFSLFLSRHPRRGVGGAPTGALSLLSRLRDATDPRERGAARPMTRDARLSALHRGDFRPGAALPSPALPPDPCSELLAARSSCLAGGVPDLPSPRLRAAAAGRHSPLRLQDRLRKTPLHERGCESYTIHPLRSQYRIRDVVIKPRTAMRLTPRSWVSRRVRLCARACRQQPFPPRHPNCVIV